MFQNLETTPPSYEADEFATSSNCDDYLGSGSYAAVRRCFHKSIGVVVVKCFVTNGSIKRNSIDAKEIVQEVRLLHRINHENIIKAFGITAWSTYFGIILEYAEKGNLEDLLLSPTTETIPWGLRLRFHLEIAKGLAYLHQHVPNKKIIHGDLKPQNILLTALLSIKIADFGSACLSKATDLLRSSSGDARCSTQHTASYSAPEFLRNPFMKRTMALDVYSMSIVSYEILTRRLAFFGVHPSIVVDLLKSEHGLQPNGKYLDEVERSILDFDDRKFFNTMKEVMEKCRNKEPSLRPGITEETRRPFPTAAIFEAFEKAKRHRRNLKYSESLVAVREAATLSEALSDSSAKVSTLCSCAEIVRDVAYSMFECDSLRNAIEKNILPFLDEILQQVTSVECVDKTCKMEALSWCLFYIGCCLLCVENHQLASVNISNAIDMLIQLHGKKANKLRLLAACHKTNGHAYFGMKKFKIAFSQYSKALDIYQNADGFSTEEEKLMQLKMVKVRLAKVKKILAQSQ